MLINTISNFFHIDHYKFENNERGIKCDWIGCRQSIKYSFDQKLWVLVARHMAIAAAATVSLQL